ncbi:acetylcholine receptor subunit beta-like 1 [Argopecten irradians]|uniref:acetylcholine receptor subunit beta-like 1 n=1 Tax=Argopecten irradians TaxID=31199 RepID=UPI003711DAB5
MMSILFLLSVSFTFSFGAMQRDMINLHHHLMTNYSTKFRPTFNLSEPTKVNIGFYLLSLKEFQEKTSKLSIFGVFALIWHDFQLEWNPEDFGGIERILLLQNEIWKPDLLSLNAFEKVEPAGFDSLKVAVYNNGLVVWAPPDVYENTCPADVTFYPFDQQSCLMYFGIYMSSALEVLLEMESNEISMIMYSPNSIWDMKSTSISVSLEGDGSQTLTLEMNFKRRPMFQIINIILPFCLLSFLNIMVFLLPAESGERIGFSVTVLLAIAVFMTIVADTLPATSEPSVPRLCYLLIAELGINLTVTIFNILLLKLHHIPQHKTIPLWLAYIVCKPAFHGTKTQHKHKERQNINKEDIRLESTLSTICEYDQTDRESKENCDCKGNGNDMILRQKSSISSDMPWQDFATHVEIVFFIFFIILLGIIKIAAYCIFTSNT